MDTCKAVTTLSRTEDGAVLVDWTPPRRGPAKAGSRQGGVQDLSRALPYINSNSDLVTPPWRGDGFELRRFIPPRRDTAGGY